MLKEFNQRIQSALLFSHPTMQARRSVRRSSFEPFGVESPLKPSSARDAAFSASWFSRFARRVLPWSRLILQQELATSSPCAREETTNQMGRSPAGQTDERHRWPHLSQTVRYLSALEQLHYRARRRRKSLPSPATEAMPTSARLLGSGTWVAAKSSK